MITEEIRLKPFYSYSTMLGERSGHIICSNTSFPRLETKHHLLAQFLKKIYRLQHFFTMCNVIDVSATSPMEFL